ncbi:MAG: 2Fe-2S iron-sulfur cluster binding domain-containing protein, partial [Rhizobiaceae bacterium]
MSLIQETDYGTPASKAEKRVTLTVDGKAVTVPEGTSIMRASMEAGIEIPKLCATDMLDSFGSCRVCLVEVEGRNGTPASCTTPAAEGMVVHTTSDRLNAIRKGVLELYVSDHPLGFNEKAGTGASEFDHVISLVGLAENRYGVEGRNHVAADIGDGVAPGEGSLTIDYMVKDESNPYFTYDPSQCIVCSRCVRACAEVQGTFALTVEGRGFESRIVASMSENFIDSECVSCGACVQACPTDALREKSVLEKGMPDRSVVTTCAYCGVGCNFKAELKGDEVVRMMPYKAGKSNHGHS